MPNNKPLVSLIVPAYNEGSIIEENLAILEEYMASLESEYRWEMLVVNDGSKDETGSKAETFANQKDHVKVVHHIVNCGLGQALKSGFSKCRGDYVVTVDLDLSYAPYHIEQLLTKIRETRAKIVVASPYMKGGRVSNVPWLRLKLSIWANRFLSATAKGDLATLTGLVRVYDGKFVRGLNLRSTGMEINPEIIHKARMLRARIDEIPAHLCWEPQKAKKAKRQSSMKIMKHTWEIGVFGFIFRPVMFFIVPGVMLLLLSLYANIWAVIHCWTEYHRLKQVTRFPDPTEAVAAAFKHAPHTFFIGGITLVMAIQLISLGILALQNKYYFEEVFYLGTSIYNKLQEKEDKE